MAVACYTCNLFTAQDVTTDGEFMNIRVTSKPALINMTGLAGNVDEGSFVSQNGIKFPINASEMEMFDFGESCMQFTNILNLIKK